MEPTGQPVKLRGQLLTSSTSLVFQTGFLGATKVFLATETSYNEVCYIACCFLPKQMCVPEHQATKSCAPSKGVSMLGVFPTVVNVLSFSVQEDDSKSTSYQRTNYYGQSKTNQIDYQLELAECV